MCKHNSLSHSHHHHGGTVHPRPHHELLNDERSSLSRKERLIKRLEVYIHHNNDHAVYFENLVNEAAELGGEQAAQLLRAAAEFTARQNENLEKTLSILRVL